MRQHGNIYFDRVDGMKEEFSWSKDVIAKMLRELAEKVESEEG